MRRQKNGSRLAYCILLALWGLVLCIAAGAYADLPEGGGTTGTVRPCSDLVPVSYPPWPIPDPDTHSHWNLVAAPDGSYIETSTSSPVEDRYGLALYGSSNAARRSLQLRASYLGTQGSAVITVEILDISSTPVWCVNFIVSGPPGYKTLSVSTPNPDEWKNMNQGQWSEMSLRLIGSVQAPPPGHAVRVDSVRLVFYNPGPGGQEPASRSALPSALTSQATERCSAPGADGLVDSAGMMRAGPDVERTGPVLPAHECRPKTGIRLPITLR